MTNKIKENGYQTFSILLALLASVLVCATATATDCRNLKAAYTYDLPSGPSGKQSLLVVYEQGGQNYPILVYLKARGKCRNVLYTEGRGLDFHKNGKSIYPDVEVYWHHGADANPPVARYVWSGNRYIDIERSKSEALNKEALKLFNQGDISGAIDLWKQAVELPIVPGLGFTSNAEALNNLGFAYYKLALKSNSAEYFKLAGDYFDNTIQVDPERWLAYLNLGDLYEALGRPEQAIWNYRKVLELNPKYKNADKIKEKIKNWNSKKNTE